MKHLLPISFLTTLALILNACGGTLVEPTISAEDIQSTAVAAAFTIVAETQAAIPTNTPIPPTDMPVPTAIPTDTPIISPTLETVLIPTSTSVPTSASNSTGGDPCNQPLGEVKGPETKIKLVNKTKGSLVVSLYLNLTPIGECGYRGYNLAKNDAITITDLVVGCYNVSVFVTESNSSSKAFGYGCINNPDLWTFEVYAESVKFVGP